MRRHDATKVIVAYIVDNIVNADVIEAPGLYYRAAFYLNIANLPLKFFCIVRASA